jgi:hypothetical protein
LVALAVILLDNWVRTGSIQTAAYAAADRGGDNGLPYAGLPGFSYPFFLGLLAILFSFGRGLVFSRRACSYRCAGRSAGSAPSCG